jgi:D-alanine-D-alanine ligase
MVLFGGRSAEHEISCISARSVIDALDPERFDVVAVGISREGRWRLLPGAPALPAESGRMPEVAADGGVAADLDGSVGSQDLVTADGERARVDVVFPVLHGPTGEDGAIQGVLTLADVPFVGAGVLGSAVGMDKAMQKVLFAADGLPVAPWEPVREAEWREDPDGVVARAGALGYPVFTKPVDLGSSVGISKVQAPDDLGAALDEAFRYSRRAVVEAGVEGAREIECAVLGNDDPVASICGEIVPTGHDFYDYSSKYLDEDGAQLRIPAELPEGLLPRVQQMAVTAFRATDCAGMARVDFFVRGEQIWINEINTIPGFTSISMYPKLWDASGLPYPKLIERLIELALERHAVEGSKAVLARELEED